MKGSEADNIFSAQRYNPDVEVVKSYTQRPFDSSLQIDLSDPTARREVKRTLVYPENVMIYQNTAEEMQEAKIGQKIKNGWNPKGVRRALTQFLPNALKQTHDDDEPTTGLALKGIEVDRQ